MLKDSADPARKPILQAAIPDDDPEVQEVSINCNTTIVTETNRVPCEINVLTILKAEFLQKEDIAHDLGVVLQPQPLYQFLLHQSVEAF